MIGTGDGASKKKCYRPGLKFLVLPRFLRREASPARTRCRSYLSPELLASCQITGLNLSRIPSIASQPTTTSRAHLPSVLFRITPPWSVTIFLAHSWPRTPYTEAAESHSLCTNSKPSGASTRPPDLAGPSCVLCTRSPILRTPPLGTFYLGYPIWPCGEQYPLVIHSELEPD